MDDLFEQLKAAPPVNKNIKPPRISTTSEGFIRKLEDNAKSSPRRESMPSRGTPIIFKSMMSNKSRSVSPPKFGKSSNSTRPLKVLVGRKKFGSAQSTPVKNEKNDSRTSTATAVASEKLKAQKSKVSRSNALFELFKAPQNILTMATSTPTKAQQKEFDTVPYDPAKLRKNTRSNLKQTLSYTRRCVVRLPRQNLNKLQNNYKKKAKPQNGKLRGVRSKTPSPQKRKNMNTLAAPPAKRGRPSLANTSKDTKPNTAFFIKLSPSTTNLLGIKVSGKKLEKPTIKTEKSSSKCVPKSLPKNSMKKIAKPLSKLSPKQRNKNSVPSLGVNSHKSLASSRIKPTKFTRTQLIKAFGKRVFKSHVRIEKCRHPLMLIFDSNERARKLQAKNSKNKNLSVSFRDQVEVFGSSDTDESSDDDNANDEEYNPKMSGFKKTEILSSESSSVIEVAPILSVTPARLKKVENGKVIDDIEFDPSLFIGSSSSTSTRIAIKSSTPYAFSPGRKRREKKSFSPLKGDATPSPRKEQFKLANEKLPPSYLRRMKVDEVDEDDDEDDECEYIVPIDFPQRRTSRASSANANESSSSCVSVIEKVSDDTPQIVESSESSKLKDVIKETTSDLTSPSILEPIVKVSLGEGKLEVLPKLIRIHDSQVANLTNSAEMLVKSSVENSAKLKEASSEQATSELEDRLALPIYTESEQEVLMQLFEKEGTQSLLNKSDILSDEVAEKDVLESIIKESVENIEKNGPVVSKSSEKSTSSVTLIEVASISKETIKSSED